MPEETPKQYVIKFKYLRNALVELGDGVIHDIPHRTIEVQTSVRNNTARPGAPIGSQYLQASVSEFDMDKIHEIKLLDETPYQVVREPNMSERYWESLNDEAYAKARENRKVNDQIRKSLDCYSQPSYTECNGHTFTIPPLIEIVDDPFKRNFVKEASQDDEPAKAKAKK